MKTEIEVPPLSAVETAFLGVNDRLDPAQLEPGTCSRAVNMRFTNGTAKSRKGIRKLNWMNRVVGRTVQPYGIVYGTGKFKDPNGSEWDVVAADGKVYLCKEASPPVELGLPTGVTITAPVTFTQCFNVLIMFRGEALPELVMEDVHEGFKAIAQLPNEISGPDTENPTDGTEPIPNAVRGTFLQNRVFIPFERDMIGASDYLNYTLYSPIRAAFRINQGSSDALVALGRFNETTLIAFKEQSVYAVGNLTGDLSEATLYEITSEYGLKAPKSIAAVGTDLWFLADKRGVCSITLTEQSKIQGVDVPVSAAIEKTIKRINWRYADKAAAAYWDNRFYLAVPLDAAEVVKRNIIDASAVYGFGGVYAKRLVTGRKYRWTKGANDSGIAIVTDTVANLLGVTYASGAVDFPTIPGDTYRWVPFVSHTGELVNGTQTLFAAGGTQNFVAQGSSVTLNPLTLSGSPGDVIMEVRIATSDFELVTVGTFNQQVVQLLGTEGEPVGSTLQPLFQGVNNAVLVYDFLTQKWSGYDQSQVLQVKDWSLATVGGRQRLIFFSEDGFLNLYEEGFYDENIMAEEPYSLEVQFLAAPAPGWMAVVDGDSNNGTEVTATVQDDNAPGGVWGIGDPALDATALANWMAPIEGGWFGAADRWTTPDHTVRRMSRTVIRFHYLTQLTPLLSPGQSPPMAARLLLTSSDPGMLVEPVAEIYFEPVQSEMVTRGFLFDTPEPKSFKRLLIDLATLKPSYSIDLLSDGVQETIAIVAGRAKSRTKYYRPHDRPDFNPTNQAGDYRDPYREDYAWVLEGSDTIYLDSKIDPEAAQEVEERFWLQGRGKHARVRVTNRDGQIDVKSMSLEALLASARHGVHA